MTASYAVSVIRWTGLIAVATLIGALGVWRTGSDLVWVLSSGVLLKEACWQSLAALFGPGVVGVVLLSSLPLIVARKRLGEIVYWAALVLGGSVLLLSRFGFIGVVPLQDGRGWLQFTSPGYADGSLYSLLEVAVIGTLLLAGIWIVRPSPPLTEPTGPSSAGITQGSLRAS